MTAEQSESRSDSVSSALSCSRERKKDLRKKRTCRFVSNDQRQRALSLRSRRDQRRARAGEEGAQRCPGRHSESVTRWVWCFGETKLEPGSRLLTNCRVE